MLVTLQGLPRNAHTNFPVAGVTSSLNSSALTLTLTLANDPESGLAGVSIAVGTLATDPTTTPNAPANAMVIPYTTYSATVGTRTVAIMVPLFGGPLYAYVRVRNGAGLVSTATTLRVR